jgi:hypothetical protein
MPRVYNLTLGIDGRYLFAGTEQGILRIAVG